MGNEMPNRTVLADAEQDSVDNQTPQEPSVGSKVEHMPKSTPSIEGPEDDLGSGSKEEAVIHKDEMAPVQVDQPFQALKSEENQKKSTHEVGVLDVSTGKTIATAEEKEKQSSTPERASVSDEEATKSKHVSSVNEELLSIDITNALGEPGPDLTNESLIPTGEKTQVTSSNKQICSSHPGQSLQSPDYLNCPKLESWHEESGDELKTPLLATAEGSPEVKKESVLPSDSNLDDSKVSLERTESEKLRMPLRHHLTDFSDTIPKQSSAPTEQGNAQVKSAEDVWESPARLVASPSRKDKQKTRSIFSQCICCPAVN